jgi:hypothetical protein
MLCYAMLCYAMLCYAMLCYAMLCYAMLGLLHRLRRFPRTFFVTAVDGDFTTWRRVESHPARTRDELSRRES